MSFHQTVTIFVFLSLIQLVSLEYVSRQMRSTWPPDVDPDPNCLDYDESKVPDCRDYIDAVTKQPVFVEHSYSKQEY